MIYTVLTLGVMGEFPDLFHFDTLEAAHADFMARFDEEWAEKGEAHADMSEDELQGYIIKPKTLEDIRAKIAEAEAKGRRPGELDNWWFLDTCEAYLFASPIS